DMEPAEVVKRAITAVLGRDATDEEVADGEILINQLRKNNGLSVQRSAELYCLTVLNWTEFLFVD
ncbi:MAG: hypothetical protein AAGI63_14505, partial [Planctomycetota bacterium]